MKKLPSNQPLVSVITPAYNRADLLEETILSVLNQGYSNLEYIILDDGSTDNTPEVIKKYKSQIKWESHNNMGETRTVNKGFSMSKGEFAMVVNSDDPLLPSAVSSLVEFMNSHPDIVVAYPDWNKIDGNGDIIEHIDTFDYSFVDMVRWHHCMPGPGAMIRKAVIDELEGRDPHFRFVADFEFWLRAGLIGQFARVPRTLATFRVHSGSVSVNAKGRGEMAREDIDLINQFYSSDRLPSEIIAVRREAYSSAYYIAGVVAGDCLPALRLKMYCMAFIYRPLKYFGEYRNRLKTMIYQLWLPIAKIKQFLCK